MGDMFIDLMNNHMLAGYFRYGSVRIYRDNPVNFLMRMLVCIDLYNDDGNIEHFVDIANWARIAFHYDRHPYRHYATEDKPRD